MNKNIQIELWSEPGDPEPGYLVTVIEWDDSAPIGAEISGKILKEHESLSFKAAIEVIKEEMVGLLPK